MPPSEPLIPSPPLPSPSRRYFGEKVGLYFAWTGHYTTWLLFASLVGVIIFFYGMSTVTTNRNPIA